MFNFTTKQKKIMILFCYFGTIQISKRLNYKRLRIELE